MLSRPNTDWGVSGEVSRVVEFGTVASIAAASTAVTDFGGITWQPMWDTSSGYSIATVYPAACAFDSRYVWVDVVDESLQSVRFGGSQYIVQTLGRIVRLVPHVTGCGIYIGPWTDPYTVDSIDGTNWNQETLHFDHGTAFSGLLTTTYDWNLQCVCFPDDQLWRRYACLSTLCHHQIIWK